MMPLLPIRLALSLGLVLFATKAHSQGGQGTTINALGGTTEFVGSNIGGIKGDESVGSFSKEENGESSQDQGSGETEQADQKRAVVVDGPASSDLHEKVAANSPAAIPLSRSDGPSQGGGPSSDGEASSALSFTEGDIEALKASDMAVEADGVLYLTVDEDSIAEREGSRAVRPNTPNADSLLGPSAPASQARAAQEAAGAGPSLQNHSAGGSHTARAPASAGVLAPSTGNQRARDVANSIVQNHSGLPTALAITPLSQSTRNFALNQLGHIAKDGLGLHSDSFDVQKLYDLADDPASSNGTTVNQGYLDSIKSQLDAVTQNKLSGTNDAESIQALQALAQSTAFQNIADKKLSDGDFDQLMAAALGSQLLSSPNATLANLFAVDKSLGFPLQAGIDGKGNLKLKDLGGKSKGLNESYLSQFSKNAKGSVSPTEWLEAAKFLSSPENLKEPWRKMDPAKLKNGYELLDQLVEFLELYKSQKLLALVKVPMKFDFKSDFDRALENFYSQVIRVSRINPPNGTVWDEDKLTRLQSFKEKAAILHRAFLRSLSKNQQMLLAHKSFEDDEFRAHWREFLGNSYFKARRDLAYMRLLNDLAPLQKHSKLEDTDLTYLVRGAFAYTRYQRLLQHAKKKIQMAKLKQKKKNEAAAKAYPSLAGEKL